MPDQLVSFWLSIANSAIGLTVLVWLFKFVSAYTTLRDANRQNEKELLDVRRMVEDNATLRAATAVEVGQLKERLESFKREHDGIQQWMREISAKMEAMNNGLQQLIGAYEAKNG